MFLIKIYLCILPSSQTKGGWPMVATHEDSRQLYMMSGVSAMKEKHCSSACA